MIEKLEAALYRMLLTLPGGPFGFAVRSTETDDLGLFPSEAGLIARAAVRRRQEFAAGRRCARRALTVLDGPETPIPIGRFRQPIWPLGFSGSITHDGRFAAAVVARSPDGVCRVAIDLVDRADLGIFQEVLETIRNPIESWVGNEDSRLAARYFAAKEAAIKIVSPSIQDFVDFREFIVWRDDGQMRLSSWRWPHEIIVSFEEINDVIIAVGFSIES